MLKVCLCKRVYFILFEKKKLLCSVIVHICNIYVNRKENIGIMKPVKVMLCHLTATICSSPKGLMFKSLMKKKIVSHINVKLFLQRDENRKSLPCTRKCNVMENLTNVNVFMRLWTDMAFLVLVLVLYMCISKCMWCVKDFIFLIVQNKSGKVIWKWIVWSLHFKREVVPVHDTLMKWKINEYNLKFKATNVRK